MKRMLTITLISAAVLLPSCDKINPAPDPQGGAYEQVFIMCGLGFNSLSDNINGNIEEMIGTVESSDVPVSGSRKAMLIFEHSTSSPSAYGTATSPHIINVYRDFLGRPIRDTLLTMELGAKLTETDIFRKGMEFIKDKFPSEHYGLLLSSHGTGWLPEGYYREGKISSSVSLSSFGEEVEKTGGKNKYYEMEITELRDAIPMHLDYLILDACLMGGVEVAYELKDKTDEIAFSVTEILSAGFEYKNMAHRLLGGESPDLEGICRDYFEKYSGSSATITYLKTEGLDNLASVCRDLFSRYRTNMSKLSQSKVQHYYRVSNRPYYFDLLDIMDKSGISSDDRDGLAAALDSCIVYKAATKTFLSIEIKNFCGLSMYLPNAGNAELNNFYKSYAWNSAAGLVE